MRDPGNEVPKLIKLRNLFISFSDWFERRGIISTHDAADPTNSTSAVRKNCTEKSRKTAETRKMRFTIELEDKYDYQYEVLQLSKTKTLLILITLPRRASFLIQVSQFGFLQVLKKGIVYLEWFNTPRYFQF